MILQWQCAAYADRANKFVTDDDWYSAGRRDGARQSQYEGFPRRETILVHFCGHSVGSGHSRFGLSYSDRGVPSEVRFLKCNKITAAVDNGENVVPAILRTFCFSGGDRSFCLLERNWRAVSRGRRW